jgi:hypothetical protein
MTANEEPGTWVQWKERHPRWRHLPGRIEWRLEWLVYWCRDLAIFEVLEFAGRLIAVVSVAVALIVWIWEAGDREKQKHYRAWELINSAQGSTGDGGRRDAALVHGGSRAECCLGSLFFRRRGRTPGVRGRACG